MSKHEIEQEKPNKCIVTSSYDEWGNLYFPTHTRHFWKSIKNRVKERKAIHDPSGQIWARSGSDWLKKGQIWNFFTSDFRTF